MAPAGQREVLAEAVGRLEGAAARLEGVLEARPGWRPGDLEAAVQAYLEALDELLGCLQGLPDSEARRIPLSHAERMRALFARHERIHALLLHTHQEIADLLPRLRQQRNTLDAYAGPPAPGGGYLDHQG